MTVLKAGDLVVLKSGGPVMTVDTVNTDIFDDNKVTGILCVWFAGDRLERARFDPAALATASSQDSPSERSLSGSHEAVGEFNAVLDEMVTAMNDAADAAKVPSTISRAAASPKSRRVSCAESETDFAQPTCATQVD